MEPLDLPTDRVRAADRVDRHALRLQIAAAAPRERLEREPVAFALDENHVHAASLKIS
jgi:hypothetical protein